MKLAISGDWHIDKDNRLEDMSTTLKHLAEGVIKEKPNHFIFLGDAYKNFRPTPIEMYYFHKTILDIMNANIDVIILAGNHDTPESDEYQGKHCFTELQSLMKGKIRVIDKPEILDMEKIIDDNKGFRTWGLFIPHIPKLQIKESYAETFNDILKYHLVGIDQKKDKVVLFSHVFISESIIGSGDIVINNNRSVSISIVKNSRIQIGFFSDIHKAQKIEPNYYYCGSIERIDFGERNDDKGFIIYDSDKDKVEFVNLNSRQMEEVIIDLINPGFIKTGTQDNVDTPKEVITDPYGYIMNVFKEKEKQLKDSIVKIKIVCTKEQKSKVDVRENDIVRILLDEILINKLKSLSYEIVDSQSVRNADINESLSPRLAFQKWVDIQDYKDEVKQHITLAGENIIKG